MLLLVLREFTYTVPMEHTAEPGQVLEVESPEHIAQLIADGSARPIEQQPQATMGPLGSLLADPIHVTAAEIERYGKDEAFARALRAHEERQG